MVIRKVYGNVFDVFLSDEGWGNWVRVRKARDGVSVISGVRVNKTTITAINQELSK